MMQSDSIARAVDTLHIVREDVLSRVSDTLDVLEQGMDTLGMAFPVPSDSLGTDSLSTALCSDSLTTSNVQPDVWLGDSLLHASHWPVTLWGDTLKPFVSLYDQLHSFGAPLPYRILGDDGVLALLLGSFLMMLLIFACSRKYLSLQVRNFFMPSNNASQLNAVKKPVETYVPLLMSLLLCGNSGLLLYAFLAHQYDLSRGIYTPLQVLGVCVAGFLGYNLLRWSLYRFVNWVFFEKSEKKTWNVGFTFLLMLETTLFYPVVLYALNVDWDIRTMAIFFVSAYGILRLLLLYHSFRIFFQKNHGLLHLFAYLCTLEMVSILCMWKLLMLFDAELIAK